MAFDKYKRQIKVIEEAVKIREAVKATHAPFVLFQPWDMLNDQYIVKYYPEGKYQKPVRYEYISYEEAIRVLNNYPGDLWCQVSMGVCIEWLFVFHYLDGRHDYTAEQNDRLTKEYIEKHPSLELLTTEEGKQLRTTISKIPQTATVRLANLQNAF